MSSHKAKTMPQWVDPDLPEKNRPLPGPRHPLSLGRDDQVIRHLADENLANLYARGEDDRESLFVAVQESAVGKVFPRAVIRAKGMRQAIDAFHDEHTRHWWLPDGDPNECQVGFPQLTPDTDFIILRKLRNEQVLGGLSLS